MSSTNACTQNKTRPRATQVDIPCSLRKQEPFLTQNPTSHILTKSKSRQGREQLKLTFHVVWESKNLSSLKTLPFTYSLDISRQGREQPKWTFHVVWESKNPLLNSKPYLSHVPKPKTRQGREQLKWTFHVVWESKNLTSLKTLPLTYSLNPNQDKAESKSSWHSMYFEKSS